MAQKLMHVDPHEDTESKPNNVGLRVIFSEKSLIALLQVILALGIAQLQFQNRANQEIPAKVFHEKLN